MPREKRSATAAKNQKLIRTIARKGLRFVGDVSTQSGGETAKAIEPPPEVAEQFARQVRRRFPIAPPSRYLPSST